jgi:hypothetical protein
MWEMTTSACSGEVTCVNSTYTWNGSATGTSPPDGTLFVTFLATLNGGDFYLPEAGEVANNGPGTCFANHCDWRIPTIAELQTIFEQSAPGCLSGAPCIDPAFGPTVASYYWSSSTAQAEYTNAWVGDFVNGVASYYQGIKGSAQSARAVRTYR